MWVALGKVCLGMGTQEAPFLIFIFFKGAENTVPQLVELLEFPAPSRGWLAADLPSTFLVTYQHRGSSPCPQLLLGTGHISWAGLLEAYPCLLPPAPPWSFWVLQLALGLSP